MSNGRRRPHAELAETQMTYSDGKIEEGRWEDDKFK